MRTLILIVILQLTVLLIETNGDLQYQFGDIIAFKRGLAPKREAVYKHYAIYVGDKTLTNKTSEDNIFEFTGTVVDWLNGIFTRKHSPIANCVYSKLDIKSDHSKDNYLDNINTYTVGSEAEITQRIEEKYKNCGKYGPRKNNCEHLATYVRYGVKVSIQHGAQTEGKAINDPNINIKEILEKIGQSDDPVCYPSPSTSDSMHG